MVFWWQGRFRHRLFRHAGRMLGQLLNPSPVPAIVNKYEIIGSLYPLDESGDKNGKTYRGWHISGS